MKRLTLATTVTTMLALPGNALAASRDGVVLSVDRAHHAAQVVDAGHNVHAYGYRGRLPKLHPGSHIRFQLAGATMSHVQAGAGRSRRVSFYGHVVRSSSHALILRLADGNVVGLSSSQISRASSRPRNRHTPLAHVARAMRPAITINIAGVQPGVTVLVTETVESSANTTITITLPGPSAPGVGGEQQAGGVLSEVGQDAFTVKSTDGSALRLHAAQSMLSGLQTCETVSATYHQDAGMLIADSVQSTGNSTSGNCASRDFQDAHGTITQVSGSALAISTQDLSLMSLTVNSPGITDGLRIGDIVDVTYSQSSSGGLHAVDVQRAEQDATGTVSANGQDSITITDSNTGQSETFNAPRAEHAGPSQDMFAGVAVGDHLDVVYRDSSGTLVADVVDDLTGGGG
jgi:hypothetical protein